MIKTEQVKLFFKDADIALKMFGIIENGKLTDKEYQGYINAFGPKLIQIGLLPAMLVYSKSPEKKTQAAIANKKPEADPSKILEAILYTAKGGTITFEKFAEEYSKSTDRIKQQYKTKVMYSIVALKLILRTYKIDLK